MIWPLIAGGAGVGFLKALRDQEMEKGDRELAAITAQYSPWTCMRPNAVKKADFIGSMAEGALGGASLGQNMERSDAFETNLAADTDLKTQQAITEKVKALDMERSKNQSLYGLNVTDAELARDYEDDNSPDPKPVSSWHPPMKLKG